jgi:hypothetical protein
VATAISSHHNVDRPNQIWYNLGKNLNDIGVNLEKSFNERLGSAVLEKGGGTK